MKGERSMIRLSPPLWLSRPPLPALPSHRRSKLSPSSKKLSGTSAVVALGGMSAPNDKAGEPSVSTAALPGMDVSGIATVIAGTDRHQLALWVSARPCCQIEQKHLGRGERVRLRQSRAMACGAAVRGVSRPSRAYALRRSQAVRPRPTLNANKPRMTTDWI
jgi:hypothetical protein